jgi:dihydrofolate reductase
VIISIIVAMDENGGIGIHNHLPWRLSKDLKRFKQLTMGHHIIMGRNTFESIGKPLPGRHMIIISRNPSYQAKDCLVLPSLEEALSTARNNGDNEAMICGGASVYTAALPLADRIYLTRVHATLPADTFFPTFDKNNWKIKSTSNYEADEKNEYSTTFQILERQAQTRRTKPEMDMSEKILPQKTRIPRVKP